MELYIMFFRIKQNADVDIYVKSHKGRVGSVITHSTADREVPSSNHTPA